MSFPPVLGSQELEAEGFPPGQADDGLADLQPLNVPVLHHIGVPDVLHNAPALDSSHIDLLLPVAAMELLHILH